MFRRRVATVFSLDQPTNPGDVWTLNATGERRPERVTEVFGYLSKDFMLPRQEAIQWKGADGVTVGGAPVLSIGLRTGPALSPRRPNARRAGIV